MAYSSSDSDDSSGVGTGTVPIFVDLQGFHINDKFVVKEFAALHEGKFLAHYIFQRPMPWSIMRDRDRREVDWLTHNHHRLYWDDGTVPYSRAGNLVRSSILTDHRGDVRASTRRRRVASVHNNDEDDDDDDNEDDDATRNAPANRRIYVKGRRKREWLLDFLGCGCENRVVSMEDHFVISRLVDLPCDGTTLRCSYHHPNCAMENVLKLYRWWRKNAAINLIALV